MLRDRYVSGRSSKRGSAALRAASDSDDSDNSATRPDVVELEERGGDDDISENHADDPAGDEDGRGDVPSVPPAVGGESWRSQRSRAVMRQLKSLSRQSSRSLKLADLERTRSLRSASSLRDGADSAPSVDRATDSGEDAAATPPIGSEPAEDEPPEDLDELEDKLSAWLQCSGLHTVDKWVLNYRKHPSCWAALLMMHGVPEVSGRLRAKVENYAIYSALFLSCTIQAAMNPPEVMNCPEREFDSDVAEWQCRVTRRVAVYALLGAIAMHFYSIILAMAFVNALNETAREADVFRIFARGQGYLATFKCQQAFRVGAGFCMLAIAAVCLEYVGWDAVAWIAFLLTYILYNFNKTSDMLFRNGSLVNYWRTELGGSRIPTIPTPSRPPCTSSKSASSSAEGSWETKISWTRTRWAARRTESCGSARVRIGRSRRQSGRRRRRSSPSCGGGARTPRARLRRLRCDNISVGRRTKIRGRKDTTTIISARMWGPRRCPSCDHLGKGGRVRRGRAGARLDPRKSHKNAKGI